MFDSSIIGKYIVLKTYENVCKKETPTSKRAQRHLRKNLGEVYTCRFRFKKKSIYMSISDDVNTKPAPAVASREKKIADPAKTSSTLNKSRVKMKKEKQANASGRRRRRHN